MSILTPSYAPDFELCRDLNRSVLEHTADEVEHHIVVPARDVPRFTQLASGRTVIHDVREYLPRHWFRVLGINAWFNPTSPWPPVRGWIVQQLVKLAAAARSSAEVVLLVDSDMVLVRPVAASDFIENGHVALYRKEGGVDARLPRHRIWHHEAARLLGLPAPPAGDLPDYVSWPCAWSPAAVRAMLQRVEEATGHPWPTAIGRTMHFSEMMLYGAYVDSLDSVDRATPRHARMRCLVHSEEATLDAVALASLLAALAPDDLAVMVSAKSGTDLAVRREALTRLADGLATDPGTKGKRP